MSGSEVSRGMGKGAFGRRSAPAPSGAMYPGQDDRARRHLQFALAVLLAVTFATGGGSQDYGPGDLLAQLLALPVLVVAGTAVARRTKPQLQRLAIGVALAIALFPALQLLPIPAWLWALPAGRAGLLRDLQAAGVTPAMRWTLAPSATERALWSQLPAMAAFFASMAIGSHGRRRLCALLVALIGANLMLGLVQMRAGQDSPLNPFPQWVPLIDGVFANPNHQATALVIGAVLAVALWLDDRRRSGGAPGSGWARWTYPACAVVFVLALPATDSRAGMLIAAPAVLAMLWAGGLLQWRKLRASNRAWVALAAAATVALGGAFAAWRLLGAGVASDARWPMARATARLARDAWPLGTGVGSFPAWFEQAGPDALLLNEYINHAHNEYVQWWLEGGLVALLLLAAALATLAAVVRTLLARRAGPLAHGAWIGLGVLMTCSIVEYPMRTAALMTVAGFLAGSAVARASR